MHGSRPMAPVVAGAGIVAQRRYRLAAVACDGPLLIAPMSGRKRIHAGARVFTGVPGQLLMVHQALAMDVENIPADDAPYRAVCIAFPWRLVAMARDLAATPVAVRRAPISSGPVAPIDGELTACAAAIGADPVIADYRRLGLLLALWRAGHDGFLAATEPGLAARIRLLVAADPGLAWTSAQLERHLHMSGATLRRHLAAEDTSLRHTVRDARMHAALALLQAAPRPLKQVAAAVGYRSAASFRLQFRQRFGVEPSRVGARGAE